MNEDFQQHTRRETVVYDSEGKEIDRLEGFVQIQQKDYEKYIPIEYHHVEITTKTYSIVQISKEKYN